MNITLELMKKIKISRNLLYKALIFVITVSVIVYFMPRDSKFNYQFDIGKPWKYGQLMATFDFPIYKGAEVIEKEQDSLMHHFQPFFNIDKEQGRKALEMLKEDCQGELSLVLPADYIRYVERQLKEIYETGILTTEALDSLQKDSTESIMIVDEKLVNQQRTDGLYSVKTAYKKLLTADTLRYRPGVLQAAGLNNYLMPNLTYDKERSEAARQELLDSYSWASGIVLSGQKIIDRGEIVSEKTYNILISYRQEFIKRSETNGQRRLVLTGQILFVGIFMLCFMLYLDLFRKGYYEHRGGMALLFAGITIYCAITGLMMSQHFMTVYMLPYAMLPIIIRVFLDSRTAFLSLVVTVLICSVSLRYPHEFILLQCVAGLTAIYSLRELSQRSQLFQTAAVVTVAYAATYFAYELMTESDPSKWNAAMYINFIINGVLLLFTYPLLFLVEKTFGFTSNVTLVELSNINTPLLRKMSETVPGTFQHSMQVANLAAAAANAIGGTVGRRQPAQGADLRAERAGGHQPRDQRAETGGQVRVAEGDQGFHLHAPRQGSHEVFLHLLEKRASGRGNRPVRVHLSRPEPLHQRAGRAHDGRLGGSGFAQPARIYGTSDRQLGRQNHRRTTGRRFLPRMSHHVQRHCNGQSSL